MRTIIYFPALLVALFLASCTSLSMTEIRDLPKTEFDPLRLEPAIETNNLRIDLVRQSHEEQVNDSTVTTEDTPYHPLGFDLGNGLFFDLNDNLSFRLDELLGVKGDNCWSVEKTVSKRQLRADYIWTVCGDTLSLSYPPGRRERYLHHTVNGQGTLSVMSKKHLLYAVDFGERQTVYRYKKRNLDVIEKTGENEYIQRQGLRKENFRLQGNRLLLNRGYIVELTDNNKKIKIIRPGWLSSRVVMTLEKGDNRLYIYDRNYHGRKLEFTGGGLTVYADSRFQGRWKLR
jgi:hypothetical protein